MPSAWASTIIWVHRREAVASETCLPVWSVATRKRSPLVENSSSVRFPPATAVGVGQNEDAAP